MLRTKVCGIKFNNPIGLAAGFDKNALLCDIMGSMGFGFIEEGSITGEKCSGNKKPRIFRIPKDKGLVIYSGLNNPGAKFVAKQFKKKLSRRAHNTVVGISIAKTNSASVIGDLAVSDYVKGFTLLQKYGHYVTINISCPNAHHSETFAEPKKLNSLLFAINKLKIIRPVFIKVKPDLTNSEVNKLLLVVRKYKFIKGFIISNLSKSRIGLKTNPALLAKMNGSVSGASVREKSTALIKQIYKKTQGEYVIIGCGGVFTAKDAYSKIRAGASLIQLITGWIYGGPTAIKEMNSGLVKLLKRDGYSCVSEAIGADVKKI